MQRKWLPKKNNKKNQMWKKLKRQDELKSESQQVNQNPNKQAEFRVPFNLSLVDAILRGDSKREST